MRNQTYKPAIGITVGDLAGIGPEITCRSLANPSVLEKCRPVIIGNYNSLVACAKQISPELTLRKSADSISRTNRPALPCRTIEVINVEATDAISIGEVSAISGRMIYSSLKLAFELLRQKLLDGMAMAPITKKSLSAAGFGFDSEFELFARLASVDEVRSVVKGRNIFRSTVVGHVPFREIPARLTEEGIIKTGLQLYEVMRRFGIEKPLLAVAALNPHAGENGLFGDEEERIIRPAVASLREEGICATGPVPADTVFVRAMRGEFDGVLFLYHDQGNIAMKTAFFGEGVVIYTGIPYVITSTGHGSAFDIVGRGCADEGNMIRAIQTAIRLATQCKTGC
jgi:4-hydroxythreonine-4-phosphate dehydrogenase